jgi:hypothetical protein
LDRPIIGRPPLRTDTMTLHNYRQSFIFEVELFALFIRVGGYELSWDRNGLCICRGMETLWANWH